MTPSGRHYVLAATIALVAMVARLGWLIQPGMGQAPSPGFLLCTAIVGGAALVAAMAGIPILLAFIISLGLDALWPAKAEEPRP